MSGTTRERSPTFDDRVGQSVTYDEAAGTYHTWCDSADYEPVSTALVTAVSTIRGVGIEDLEPLSRSVDPDALNALATHWEETESERDCSITFPFADCTVTVRSDGKIVIDPDRPVRIGS